ncbi:MAG: hypothetical protein COB51_09815 [Moraxellaceae bacterium]|nr:MAG: hypothetical protein COB51_09815 [Moraxellaceae bacterium]
MIEVLYAEAAENLIDYCGHSKPLLPVIGIENGTVNDQPLRLKSLIRTYLLRGLIHASKASDLLDLTRTAEKRI